jgi:hypothetical protein
MTGEPTPKSLPIYVLEPPRTDTGLARQLFQRIARVDEVVVANDDDRRVRLTSDGLALELEKRSDYLYLERGAALWNPRLRPKLPDAKAARAAADDVVNTLTPYLYGERKVSARGAQARQDLQFQRLTYTRSTSRKEGWRLDVQAIYNWSIDVPRAKGGVCQLPVTGGGGKFRVAFGEGNSLIGLSGGWRNIAYTQDERPVISRERAERKFRQLLPKRRIQCVRSQLAYYAAPAFRDQRLLVPVWLVDGEVTREGQRCKIRTQIIPATEVDTLCEPRALERSIQPLKRTAQPLTTRSAQARAHTTQPPPFTCGAEWFGEPGDSFEANKNGFLNGCRAMGGAVKFDRDSNAASEQDFRAKDHKFADAVNIVFFTGHANADGWEMQKPKQYRLSWNPIDNKPPKLGDEALRWLVIGACGPLQDTPTKAVDRWRRVFNGLHGMLGYGSESFSEVDEGQRFMEHLKDGMGVVDAWLRTAVEVQPAKGTGGNASGVIATAMYAHGGDHATSKEVFNPGAPPTFDVNTQQVDSISVEI